MKIILNGEQAETSASTLEDLCHSLGHEPTIIATAVNGEFVTIKDRATFKLEKGARIEIVSPRQGG